jgi:2-dehydropantoate 2-reductase
MGRGKARILISRTLQCLRMERVDKPPGGALTDEIEMSPSSHPVQAPNVAILGSGSLACFLGAALADEGVAVRLLSTNRPAGPMHISVEGGVRPLAFTFAVEPPSSRALEGDEVLILASKASVCRSQLEQLSRADSPPETWVACNGLGLLEGLPVARYERGLTRLLCGFGVREAGPGLYQFSGAGAAEYSEARASSFAPILTQALTSLNISVTRSPNFHQSEWKKIAWNASMNGILALEGLRNGALVNRPALLARFDALLMETITVARLEGVELDAQGTLRAEILESIQKTAGNLNSMAMDLRRNRPTEVQWINGAVVRAAARHGIRTPENERLLAEILNRQP